MELYDELVRISTTILFWFSQWTGCGNATSFCRVGITAYHQFPSDMRTLTCHVFRVQFLCWSQALTFPTFPLRIVVQYPRWTEVGLVDEGQAWLVPLPGARFGGGGVKPICPLRDVGRAVGRANKQEGRTITNG